MNSLPGRIRRKVTSVSPRSDTPLQRWDRRWKNRAEPMRWETDVVPEPLVRALETGFFPAGASVLDLGCGAGTFAAWLAERNHPTLGRDFSPEAIVYARKTHQHDLLRFEVSNVATPWTSPEQFDCAFDRGCFHCLDGEDRLTYVANIAASVRPGGTYLLLHHLRKIGRDGTGSAQAETVLRAELEEAFTIEAIEDVDIIEDSTDDSIPAFAVWMTRQAPTE